MNRKLVAVTLVALVWSGLAFCGEIHVAAKSGDLEKVKALLKANPDLVSSKDDKFGGTPLHLAAATGHKDVAELLLINKADVNAQDNNSNTPLHVAAFYGQKEVLELLLANKANVNAKESDGTTPLLVAVQHGYKDMAELLLASKADVNAEDNYGSTPLHAAARHGYKDMAELLLVNKADVNAKSNNGGTPVVGYFEIKGRETGSKESTVSSICPHGLIRLRSMANSTPSGVRITFPSWASATSRLSGSRYHATQSLISSRLKPIP